MSWKYDQEKQQYYNTETGAVIASEENMSLYSTAPSRRKEDPYGDGYRSNNLFRRGTMQQVLDAYEVWHRTGKMPTAVQLGISDGAYKNVVRDVEKFAYDQGIDFATYKPEGAVDLTDPITGSENPRDVALNTYYKDLYNPDIQGTGGYDLNKNLEGVFQRESDLAASMADVQFKDSVMNQAAVVKQITDQVRGERMARLKAGMSEAQIANQDMQMMMANVNTLNQNNAMLAGNRAMARAGQMTAKDQAYMAYLDQANARGQNAAAFSAADAGNLDFMTKQRMQATDEDYKTAADYTSGNVNK